MLKMNLKKQNGGWRIGRKLKRDIGSLVCGKIDGNEWIQYIGGKINKTMTLWIWSFGEGREAAQGIGVNQGVAD